MGSRVLKLHSSKGEGDFVVEMLIDDIDECLMIDVLNDMYDVFEKRGYELPTYPALSYYTNEQSVNLTDDGTLMRMFDVIESREIDVWIVALEEPNFIWNLAKMTKSQASQNKLASPTKPNKVRPDQTYSAYSFRKALEQVQQHGGLGAVKWFKDIGPLERWTRWRFDPTLCNDENTNNFVESFNSTIGVDRTYPVMTLLEGVRRIAMVRHATRQSLSEQWQDEGICPNIRQRLRVLTKDSRTCHAYPSGRGNFEIHDGRARLPVSTTAKTCACGLWQISGIPCKHGIKAILHLGRDPVAYVSEWFSLARYRQAYSGNISPIPDVEQWPHMPEIPKLTPPTMKRSIGRPSRNRRREVGEQRKGKRSATIQCSKCKAFGHNALSCKGGLTARELAEQEGKGVPDKSTKQARKKKSTYPDDAMDTNLIELMINGTCDEYVDPPTTQNPKKQKSNKQKSKNTVAQASQEFEHDVEHLDSFDVESLISSMIESQPTLSQININQASTSSSTLRLTKP